MAKEKDPRLVALGERVKSLRTAAGLSQQELADRVGMHRISVGRIESGAFDVGYTNLLGLAAALGVDVSDLSEPKS